MTPDNLVISETPPCDCPICMVPHDDEIHTATLNLREWFRCEVTKYFFDDIPVEEGDAEWFLVA